MEPARTVLPVLSSRGRHPREGIPNNLDRSRALLCNAMKARLCWAMGTAPTHSAQMNSGHTSDDARHANVRPSSALATHSITSAATPPPSG
jgi:hypothetical protein